MKKLIYLLFTVFAMNIIITTHLFASGTKEEKNTNELIIYSPNSEPLIHAVYTFGLEHGINVEIITMGTGQCAEHVVAEAENPKADVWYGGLNYTNGIKYAQYFEPYVAQNNNNLPKAYQNLTGCVTSYCLDGSAALLINKDVFKKLGLNPDSFKGYNDLLNPKLKGHITMGNPINSASAWAELTNMLLVMGKKPYDEEAWIWVEKLIKQLDGNILNSSSAIYTETLNGEYAVGISYEDPCLALLKDGATNVSIIYPCEGAVWLPAGAAILKGAKNMKNAKLFLDWLVSDEGQKEIAKSTARPVNSTINNTSDVILPFYKINVAYEHLAFCAEHKTEWQERWTKIIEQEK